MAKGRVTIVVRAFEKEFEFDRATSENDFVEQVMGSFVEDVLDNTDIMIVSSSLDLDEEEESE